MKLNYRRTLCVGFAFFLITAFWQAYDTIIPKILTDRFGMSQTLSGIIMALDNVLALFLLPIFGIISDKCKSKLGKRTPFIIAGTLAAVVTFSALSFVDAAQLKKINAVTDINATEVREILYDYEYPEKIVSPSGEEFVLNEKFEREEFLSAPATYKDNTVTEVYTDYIVPARQAYIKYEITEKDPSALIFFIGLLLAVLISMATFRTPAVALMPDVTPKPLRSKGNAVINLMGTIGGSCILGLGIVMGTGKTENTFMNYTGYFLAVAGLMLVCLGLFVLTVKENKFVREMEETSKKYGIDEGEEEAAGKKKLTKGERRSFLLLLASVIFWYAGYNAVISKYSVYASNVLDLDYNSTLLVANIAALIAFIPVGIISTKVGRKKMVIAGVVMLGSAFLVAAFLSSGTPAAVMMVIFALAGIGWATINVNSFPMVVELAKGGNVGRYTGFYYTASMAAQTLTPVLSGLCMDNFGMRTLFPYATVFVVLSLLSMLLVRHGDATPVKAKDASDYIPDID
ncbi:MAG: MFS transporter [Clostridia bacterium]|nr:MFS transporter [Clostridia bacterium]